MPDRERVMKGLEMCTAKPCYCTDCPYEKACALEYSQELMEDALALLKEQEETISSLQRTINRMNKILQIFPQKEQEDSDADKS